MFSIFFAIDTILGMHAPAYPLFRYKNGRVLTLPLVAGAERLELSRTVLETAMLPLHHAPIGDSIIITSSPFRVNK